MAEPTVIDVAPLIERQRLTGFVMRLIVLSWVITFFDGFDTNVIAFAAPYLATAFKIDRAAMGYLFSAGLIGTMIGGFAFAYIGDRIGRRPSIIAATALFGLLTLIFALSTSYTQLVVIRLIDGLALGGMLPLCWALNIEYVPRRFQASVVTVIMLGYSFGVAIGGPIANVLIPRYGWQSVYVFGGVCSLIAAALLFAFLPESIKFLTATRAAPERVARSVRQMLPDFAVAPGTRFILSDERAGAAPTAPFRVSVLFAGVLKWVTPLFWFAYIVDSMAVFFLATWSPLVFEAMGLTRADAASFAAVNSLGGALGGLLLMRFIDNRGPGAITIMPLLAIPLLLIVGSVDLGHWQFLVLMFLVFLTIVGGHYGMHSTSGLFYPTAYRANGAGWATSMAKIGSIAGPTLGGLILATKMPVREIFICLALCPALMALCTWTIGRLYGSLRAAPAQARVA
ncbi:MAG TPA: MFS transporter [Acetobacteraceae bacterium]|jgi:AAHS family 4-hydroxybenzoate transporter-like MFS transporter|nr:MFS transporter [Acetobacteraceae bacterium]